MGFIEKIKKLAPYALHLAMVVAVGIYVIAGAITIRQIEATPREGVGTTEKAATSRMKRETHEIRRFSMNRTRHCVMAAMLKINQLSNCSRVLDGSHMDILDECYEHDLRKIADLAKINRRKEETTTPVTGFNATSSDVISYDYWSLMDSVLFCFTVITTIGYGNVAPRSFNGRLFVIIYGLIGVPFTMLAIANLGKFLATVLKSWTRPFVRCFKRLKRRCFHSTDATKEKQHLMDKEKKPNKSIDGFPDSDSQVVLPEAEHQAEPDPGHEEPEPQVPTPEPQAKPDPITGLVLGPYPESESDSQAANMDDELTKSTSIHIEIVEKKAKKIEDDETSNSEDDAPADDDDDCDEYEGIVLFLSFVFYIVVGSIAIAAYEPEMDFFEAIYFNFVTLTTIGLGDLVPQSESYLVITLLYCAVGLALTTIAIEIAADTLKKLHYFGRKVENAANVQVWFGGKKISMKALVKNLGDQLNVPIEDLATLNIDKFVDDAIKVEQGELATLRVEKVFQVDKDWMNSNYWRAIESGSMHYVDDDDLVTLQSNRSRRQLLLNLPPSRSYSPMVEISEHAPFVPSPMASSLHEASSLSERERFFRALYADAPKQLKPGTPLAVPNDEANKLIMSYKLTQREKEKASGRWSEEARKRYEAYQQTWKRYKHTSEQPKK